ncbi:uncharacterized protein [Acropora muricata]|uniref:uncharacterized protein LOC114976800 n=1 Tax=Acropora millepora TaxID=45264 RepID=UPI001CF20459|nr:uncharacterized protein LOC114976800 [Acropora millepora]
MGIRKFLRRMKCFGSSGESIKSKKQMEREVIHMKQTIRVMERTIRTKRWVLEECKRQQLAEKREQIFLEKRGILMEKVAKIEIELQEALKYRQMTMADIIKTGLRKVTLENDVKAMQKKIEFFRNDLGKDPNPLKTWRENLRLIRSQNDMDKAVPQPPLFPILDFEEGELIWQLSDDNLEDDNVNWQLEEEGTVAATYL